MDLALRLSHQLHSGWTHENCLAHERELLRVPDVPVVNGAHQDVGQDDTNILVDLEPDGAVQTRRADEIPVERPRQQAHALIVARAAENVAEHQAVVVREAEDRDSGEQWEDPCARRDKQENSTPVQ